MGKLETRLHFRAQMDRRRSWWNPKLKEIPEAYVLQHEQIHFAIAALEAQNLNASAAELTADMRAEGDSPDSVKEAIQVKLDDVIRAALTRLIDRNGKFDEDTSARYAPKKQDQWWQRVSSELRKKLNDSSHFGCQRHPLKIRPDYGKVPAMSFGRMSRFAARFGALCAAHHDRRRLRWRSMTPRSTR